MDEIRQHSQQHSHAAPNRVYLQQVVENALQQTERVCAMIKQLADSHEAAAESGRALWDKRVAGGKHGAGMPAVMLSSGVDQDPLTRLDREFLNLSSEGFAHKQGALRMRIRQRTFQSQRAVAI